MTSRPPNDRRLSLTRDEDIPELTLALLRQLARDLGIPANPSTNLAPPLLEPDDPDPAA